MRRISGGNYRRVSGTSASRGDAGASRSSKRSLVEVVSDVEEEEEEEEPTKHGKKGESTASDSEDELQREPSPKRTKQTKKKEGGEEDDKGAKRRRAEGRMQDKKATALRAQAKVIVTELVEKKVLDPANLWTDDTPRIPDVARALTDYCAHFGVAPVEVAIRLKSYFMYM